MFGRLPDGSWHPFVAILKISKVTFWIVWVTPVLFGYLASATRWSPRHVGWFALAVVGTMIFEGVNCLHNELVDQEEDRINQPNRALLLAAVGERTLWRIIRIGYWACFLGLVPIAIVVGPAVATVMALGAIAAPMYNWGPRLKRRPGLAQVAIGWAVFCAYLYGWMWNGGSIGDVPQTIWVLSYFFFVTSLLKDLPDVTGDEQVDAPGVFSIRHPPTRRAMLLFIYFSPYALIVALVAAGILEPRFLWLCWLLLGGALVSGVAAAANELKTMIVAYEFAFTYVHIFFLALFVVTTPTQAAMWLAVILFALRLLALGFGLAPRFVEADFSWGHSTLALARRALRRPS